MATRLRAGLSGFRIATEKRNVSFLQNVQASFCSFVTEAIYQCRTFGQSPSSSIQVTNEWSYTSMDQDSVVGIATRYMLDSLEFEFRWEEEMFCSPHPTRPTLSFNRPLYDK
jgi:hypothetical protein